MLTIDTLYPPGTTLNDRFNILSLVNQGAQAAIFKATDMTSGDIVVLKLVSEQQANYISGVERLKGEFDVLTALDGLDMFLKPFELEVNTHEAYIAMEWIEDSTDGNAFIRQHMPMDFKTWLWIAKRLSTAVDLCHQRKIIHRDLKPGNILFASQGVIKLCDFGISQNKRVINITDTDIQMGTVLYLPPELILDGDYGIPGEMYALGVTLYEFLCGRVPFYANSPGEIIQKKINGTFDRPSSVNPDIPQWVDSIFNKLLAPSPHHRFQGVRELLSHLSIKKSIHADDEIITFHRCDACNEPLWKELSFCTHCGAIYHINAVAGKHGLIAKSVDDPDQFLKIFNQYTNNRLPGWRAHLFKSSYPRLMLTGVSENSAHMIAEALTNKNSSIQISSMPYFDALKDIKLSLPQALLAGLTIYLLFTGIFGVYGFSSKFFRMIMICLSAIVFTGIYAMMPLVSIDTVSNLAKHREWQSLSEIRGILLKISNKQIRQKASALIRRSVLLFDGIQEFNLAPSMRLSVINNLDKLSLTALERLVLMNQRLDSLLKYRKQGLDKKIESLESLLKSTKDLQIRKRVIDRIGELSNLKNEQIDIEKQYAGNEVEYSNVLSGLNSMYLYLINRDFEQLQNEMRCF